MSTPKTFQLDINDLTIHVESYGQGAKHVFYFHGFGQKCDDIFAMLSDDLLKRFTFHSFGLFFHQSKFPKERLKSKPLDDRELHQIIDRFQKEKNINEYHLMGYSIGARMCFSLINHPHSRSILLMAPDGVSNNLWYYLFTRASFFQDMALWFSRQRKFADLFLSLVHKVGYYSEFEMKLIRNNAQSSEKLERVFSVWNCYRKINRDFKESMRIIRSRSLPHLFIFGKRDKVLGVKAIKEASGQTQHVLSCDDGHDLIRKKNGVWLEEFMGNISRYLPSEI